jgi:hypothetical protein
MCCGRIVFTANRNHVSHWHIACRQHVLRCQTMCVKRTGVPTEDGRSRVFI